MKLQDLYQVFSLFSYAGYIQDYIRPSCDQLACYTQLVPHTCQCCPAEERINMAALQEDLDNRLFGQPLAKEVILSLMQNEDRVKPIVLSFHGLTGSGKSHAARILAKHFDPMGLDSKFVHKIVTTLSFPHESEVKTYKDQLHAWIRGNVSRCERSLFIFEDVNKMHPELLHSLRPYLDYHDKIDGVSYRKSIFIFTSDTGANVISDYALEVRSQGKRRKEIKLFDVQRILTSHLLKARNSEFYDCDLIKNKVIDIFVPFLPLELKHVKMCVRAELERQERTEDEEFVSRVVEEMDYYPKGEKVYSKNGCKNVHVRVDLPYPTALQLAFDKNIFGQHLAKQAIPNAVSQFLNNETPKKPLVLSLHGRSGTGKSYVTKILVNNIYPDYMWKKCVHIFVAPLHFPHFKHLQQYKDQLHAWIRGNVSRCERSLFIFEDVHIMHPELLHSLRPYLDYHDKIDGVSYRKCIFIFTSCSGANVIEDIALEVRRQRRRRGEIQLIDIQRALTSHLLEMRESEFYNSDLIRNKVIDIFVPYLPLELEHVMMCVRAELERQERTEDEGFVSRIAAAMIYYPTGENFFSASGCKSLHSKIDIQ